MQTTTHNDIFPQRGLSIDVLKRTEGRLGNPQLTTLKNSQGVDHDPNRRRGRGARKWGYSHGLIALPSIGRVVKCGNHEIDTLGCLSRHMDASIVC